MRIFLSITMLFVAIMGGFQHVVSQDPGVTGKPDLVLLDAPDSFKFFDNSFEKGLVSASIVFDFHQKSYVVLELVLITFFIFITFFYSIRASPRFSS